MIAGNYGGDNFFGVYDKKSPVEVENIINAYNDKMSYGSYYTLCVYKCLDERTIDNRIEECCSLAAMSPEFNSILKHFMESFDLERAISELEDEGVVPSKGYKEYILAMEHGFPPISGIGFGIDVFIYHLMDCENIRDTILFPITKPLDNDKETENNED